MRESFNRSLAFILKEEGGNSDDPHDHGGRTSRGITQREYDAYRANRNEPPSDVWAATDEEVHDIYKKQYWDPYCDDMPAGIDLLFFNESVNAGRTQAVKDLQRALGVPVDGMYGMRTKAAVLAADPIPLINDYADRLQKFYRALRQYPRYGKGWSARTERARNLALSMTSPAAVPVHISSAVESPRANPMDVSEGPISAENAAVTTGGTATLTGIVEQAKEMLGPYADVLQTVKWILLALTIAGLGMTVYAFLKRKKAQEVT